MSIRHMTLSAMLTALLCIVGPVTLPLGPIPLSLTTGALMLIGLLLGPRRAPVCCLLYLLIGLLGLPVFSGFAGGAGALLGPTGGFLLGYLPLAAVCGLAAREGRRRGQLVFLLAGTALLYLTGTAWYCWQSGVSAFAALGVCVLPFLPGDALKIAAVLTGGNGLRARLKKAGVI